MTTERWYVRYAWVWFAAVSVVGQTGGLLVFVNPSARAASDERLSFSVIVGLHSVNVLCSPSVAMPLDQRPSGIQGA